MKKEYKIEPIMNLTTFEAEWAEILLGDSLHFPKSFDDWSSWYQKLPRLIDLALSEQDIPISLNVDTDHIINGLAINTLRELRGLPILVEWTERRGNSSERIDTLKAGQKLAELCGSYNFSIVLDDVGSGEDMMTRLIAISAYLSTNKKIICKIDGELFQDSRRNGAVKKLLFEYMGFFTRSNIDTCVEWIESPNDLRAARELGARWGQGYLWKYNQKPTDAAYRSPLTAIAC